MRKTIRLQVSFCRAPTHADIGFLNLLQLKNQRSWSKKSPWLFCYFDFERNYDVLKSKSPCFLLNKNINLNKNGKWKIPYTAVERWTMCFSSYNNRELKVKLWWVGARERSKSVFFVLFFFFCPKEILLAFVFDLNV